METQTAEKTPPQPATEAPQAPPQGDEAPTCIWRSSRYLQGIQDTVDGEVRPLKGRV
jgi:hypothetical protein